MTMKITWFAISLSAALMSTGALSRQAPDAAAPPDIQSPEVPPTARRIVFDASGMFILPDGSTAARDPSGGFTLPNGSKAAPDGGGGLILPNGDRCGSDGAQGYICP
jgi:hypothetical protein